MKERGREKKGRRQWEKERMEEEGGGVRGRKKDRFGRVSEWEKER